MPEEAPQSRWSDHEVRNIEAKRPAGDAKRLGPGCRPRLRNSGSGNAEQLRGGFLSSRTGHEGWRLICDVKFVFGGSRRVSSGLWEACSSFFSQPRLHIIRVR